MSTYDPSRSLEKGCGKIRATASVKGGTTVPFTGREKGASSLAGGCVDDMDVATVL